MSYEFTKLSDVPVVAEFPEGANAIIETNGEIKRCPSGGGGGSVPKPLTYDYMPEGYPTKAIGTVTLMEEQEVEFALSNGVYSAAPTNTFEIIEGQTYTVNWDGTEYECVCSAFNSLLVLGNLSIYGIGNDTGEPFIYAYNSNQSAGGFTTLDTSASHTISVKTAGEVATPIAEEFLPENLATKSEVEIAQTAANSNKEVLDRAFSSVATFTFDKQTSGRDTFAFDAYDCYKISDFNPAPNDVISFTGTRESGDNFSKIAIGSNCVSYGLFIVVASSGACSIPLTETVTGSFVAPSAGLYAMYEEGNTHTTAGTGQFTLMSIDGLTIKSSTYGSTKKFRITVDDSGTISATEVT